MRKIQREREDEVIVRKGKTKKECTVSMSYNVNPKRNKKFRKKKV